MPRTVYFVGSEPDCVSGSYTLSTTGVDTNYVRTGFKVFLSQSATIIFQTEAPANSTDGYWVHCRKYQGTADDVQYTSSPILIYDASNNLSAGLVGTASNGVVAARVYANDGTYTQSGNYADFFGDPLTRDMTVTIDLHVYTNDSGYAVIEAYLNGNLIATATDTSGYQRGAKKVVFTVTGDDTNKYKIYSEFIVANFDTRGLRVGTYYPSANGTYTDGTGAYTDIDETSPDGAVITLAAVGDKQSYALTRQGTPTLGAILAVAVNGLVASDGTNDLQAGLRIGGVDYFSSDLGLGASPSATSVVWNTNPADGGYLPQNPATDIEVIYKAVA